MYRMLLMALAILATATICRAAIDNAMCSTADAGAVCSGAETISSANEEFGSLRDGTVRGLSSVSGTVNAITATTTPAITSYIDNTLYMIKPSGANTGAVTLNIQSIGAKSVVTMDGAALTGGELQASSIYLLRYYAGGDHFRILNGAASPQTLGTGVATFLGTPSSANLATALTDETGSGAAVFASSPSLTTPTIGGGGANFSGATSGTTNVKATAIAGTTTLTLPAATDTLVGKATTDTLTNKSIDLGSNTLTTTSAQLATAISNETGSGAAVFATSPALVTPDLGTPSAATLTNATGLPITTGVSGMGSNVATFLATPSSANLASALTNETGSGVAVFGTSPSLTTPAIGSGGFTIAGSSSGTTTVVTNAAASGTITVPAATDTLVGKATTDTLTNKSIDLGSNTLTTTSAQLAIATSDETGSGALVFSASPTFTGTVSGEASTWSGNMTLSGTSANVVLGSNYITNDGVDRGISIASSGAVSITSNATATGLSVYNTATSGQARITLNAASTGGGLGQIDNNFGHLYITNNSATSDILLRAGGAERARITYSGKMGIGTSAPGQTLDVQGAAQFGTGNVDLITAGGQLTGLSSTYVAATTSSDLAGVISDETGSGSLVFGTSPTFTTNVTLGSDTVSDFTGLGLALSTGSLGLDATGATDEFCLTYEATGPTVQWQACGGGGGGSPGGSSNQLQFNNAGVFDGVTLSGDVTISMPSGAATVVSASTSTAGKVELATDAEAEAGTDTGRVVTPSGLLASIAGKKTIWVPAAAMTTETTTGCAAGTVETATNQVMYKSLDCDAATKEGAQFTVAMPKSWNESTITFRADWTAASGSGDVVWAFSCLSVSNDDPLDAAFGTEVTVTDTLTAAGDLDQSPESGVVTASGTPAENDTLLCRVQRDAASGSDTLGVDARLLGVRILYSTNAMTDD